MPDSEELKKLVKGSSERDIYRILYSNRDKPLTMADIRSKLDLEPGEQEHLNRRMRELYRVFEIERSRRGTEATYRLIGRTSQPNEGSDSISKKIRAWVLRNQRCAQCGRTPLEDNIKLHVDHKVPQAWGGNSDPDNLQALCSDCNQGKKDLYSTYEKYAEQIKQAANYDEPHKRIGELLKAFKGDPVPSDLIELVAQAKQYQEDWQRRLRELRELGWQYSYKKRKEKGRVRTYFYLEHHEPWPEGNIKAEIRRRELQKKR